MQSIEEIYREHSQTVYRYLLSLTHDTDLSEELTQETFYQAVKSIGRFNETCKITTWLCAIAKNALLSYRRKHPIHEELDLVSTPVISTENTAMENLSNVELLRKLHLMDAEVREVLYLRLFGNLTFREIGDILARTENWARVTFYRGKEKLKKELETDGE